MSKMNNEQYNTIIDEIEADDTVKCPPEGEYHGKKFPYIGWYWRDVDFASGYIPVGNCGMFKGFIENNKWGYDERSLKKEEVARLMSLIDDVLDAYKNDKEKVTSNLSSIWQFMKGLSI